MATYTKELLSGSAYGAPIVVSTAVPSLTTIHTTGVTTTNKDELWLYASNPNGFDVNLYIVAGGDSLTNNVLFYGSIDAFSGNVLLCPGLLLTGDGAAGLIVKGAITGAAGVTVFGYINRITPE